MALRSRLPSDPADGDYSASKSHAPRGANREPDNQPKSSLDAQRHADCLATDHWAIDFARSIPGPAGTPRHATGISNPIRPAGRFSVW